MKREELRKKGEKEETRKIVRELMESLNKKEERR